MTPVTTLGAHGVVEPDVRGQSGAQLVEGRDDVVGEDQRRTPAEHPGIARRRADEREVPIRMTAFARNPWCVAAYGRETGRELLGRTILNEPVAFHRGESDGTVVALADRCVHRRHPLTATTPYSPMRSGRRAGR